MRSVIFLVLVSFFTNCNDIPILISLTGKVLFEAENVEQTLKLNKRCDIDFNGGDFARIDKFVLNLLIYSLYNC